MESGGSVEGRQWNEKTLRKANFCREKCTACKLARKKGKGLFYQIVKLEAKLCPWCRAYAKVYGVPAYQEPPS